MFYDNHIVSDDTLHTMKTKCGHHSAVKLILEFSIYIYCRGNTCSEAMVPIFKVIIRPSFVRNVFCFLCCPGIIAEAPAIKQWKFGRKYSNVSPILFGVYFGETDSLAHT